MFSLNSGQRHPKLSEIHRFWSFDSQGRLVIEFLSSLPKITPSVDEISVEEIQIPLCGPVENINPAHAPADRFMDGNNERLLDFNFPPSNELYGVQENKGLPPDFVGNFCLKRVFTEPWEDADLTHALTGLDYLTNLECARRTALRGAAQRLRISEDTWQSVLAENSQAIAWVRRMQEQEHKVEACYSNLWLDLRVWTMGKELLSEPFYKLNVIAMLNTLFPPVVKELPSLRITANTLHQHRSYFYRYIISIDVNGKSQLDDFIKRLDRPGTGHTWLDVREGLKDYVKLADSMIKQASQVHDISFFKSLLEEHPALRSTRVSGTESTHSNPTSLGSQSTKSCQDELKRISTRSGGKPESENTGSLNSSTVSKSYPSSPDSEYVLPSRSKLSGKVIGQRISNEIDTNILFHDSPQPPWYSSPRRASSASGCSLGSRHNASRQNSSSFSRPLTPSILSATPSVERHRVHRRSVSANKRISYDFHNALPGTPELPSPQASDKKTVSQNIAASQAATPLDRAICTEEQLHHRGPPTRDKKPGFSMFRRKKKLESALECGPTVRALRDKDSRIDMLMNAEDSKEVTCHPADQLAMPEQHSSKKKPSFRFLQRKSNEDYRAVSDSNSDRTVTAETGRTIKPKRSLTNLFTSRGTITSGLGIDVGEDCWNDANPTVTVSEFRHTLRKARSHSSVRSCSSTYSNEAAQKASNSGASSVADEDRIITSADIDEPFPFGNFVQPQTPAMLFEDPEERQDNEAVRKALIEKARNERMAKWEQSEESKRKLEASRQKRRILREEMDANMQASRINRQKRKEGGNKGMAEHASVTDALRTPNPGVQGFGKPPKTPMKERVLKLIADSYSPTSPSMDH